MYVCVCTYTANRTGRMECVARGGGGLWVGYVLDSIV